MLIIYFISIDEISLFPFAVSASSFLVLCLHLIKHILLHMESGAFVAEHLGPDLKIRPGNCGTKLKLVRGGGFQTITEQFILNSTGAMLTY